MAVWKRARHSTDLLSFLQNPDAWVAKGAMLKDSNSATVVRVLMDGRPVVIKRNNIKNLRHWWRRCLRPTRSHVNWRNAHLLKISGITTPEPIAFTERRVGLFRLRGYYVCAFNDFPSAAQRYASQKPTARELAWFGELFTGLHLAQLYHGDLKASNFLVTDKGINVSASAVNLPPAQVGVGWLSGNVPVIPPTCFPSCKARTPGLPKARC